MLIYGAGSSGRQLADVIANIYEIRLIGFLDDDERLHKQNLNEFRYTHQVTYELIDSLRITDIYLAMPREVGSAAMR